MESNIIPMFRAIFYYEFTSIVSDSLKGNKNMDYKTMRDRIGDMVNDNHRVLLRQL